MEIKWDSWIWKLNQDTEYFMGQDRQETLEIKLK